MMFAMNHVSDSPVQIYSIQSEKRTVAPFKIRLCAFFASATAAIRRQERWRSNSKMLADQFKSGATGKRKRENDAAKEFLLPYINLQNC